LEGQVKAIIACINSVYQFSIGELYQFTSGNNNYLCFVENLLKGYCRWVLAPIFPDESAEDSAHEQPGGHLMIENKCRVSLTLVVGQWSAGRCCYAPGMSDADMLEVVRC